MYDLLTKKYFNRCLCQTNILKIQQISPGRTGISHIPRFHENPLWLQRCRIFLRCSSLVIILSPNLFFQLWLVKKCVPSVSAGVLIKTLECTGPTGIKLLQWAGTRRDLLSPEMIEKLSKYHSSVNVSKVSKTGMEKVIQDERIDGLGELQNLLGSGSIAQVYLSEYGKKPVAVKIVKPGTREKIETDLEILKLGATFIEKIPGIKALGLSEAVDQFKEFLLPQVDLRIEAGNLIKFRENFRHSKSPIVFPEVFYASESVLIESYAEGVSLNEVLSDEIRFDKSKKRQICDVGIKTFLTMLFKHNFVHGDLHPGNVIYDEKTNKISFIDCGLTSSLTKTDFENFTDLFYAIVVSGKNKDVGRLMIERSRAPIETVKDPAGFILGIEKILDRVGPKREGFSFKAVELGDLFGSLLTLAYHHSVKLEANFVSTCCALMVLEGVGKSLDPDRDVIGAAKPYLIDAVKLRRKLSYS
jgi:aarF domain-containing kinase